MPKLGVIDLGTNTFHLLISEILNEEITVIYRERIFVKLAEEGIEKIGDAALIRATNAIAKFKTILDQHQVNNVRAFGTEGLRNASNSAEFIHQIKSNYDLDISVISGDEEARLIHKGVSHALGKLASKSLIMDIGGGSVEFIICDNDKVYWAKSFPIGVAVLFNSFQQNDPIADHEIKTLNQYLKSTLEPLQKALQINPATTLIGASGTFDVLEDIVVDKKQYSHSCSFSADKFTPIYSDIISTNIQQKLADPKIPDDRVDLITVAVVLLNHILQLANSNEIIVSSYALKEGILFEMENS